MHFRHDGGRGALPELWEPIPAVEQQGSTSAAPVSPISRTHGAAFAASHGAHRPCAFGAHLCFRIFGPILSSHSYREQNLNRAYESPSAEHWFGTDAHGRDLFVRVMMGGRISLLVGIIATATSCVIGVLYGGFSGYMGGRWDNILMRLVDIASTIPLVLYSILLMVLLGTGLHNIFIALGLVYWVGMVRIVRGQVLALKEQEFVLAARVLGAGTWRLLTRHLIPNAMGPILVTATMMIPGAIFTESFLSFIGIGISAPMASWGSLCSDALGGLRSYPYQLFFPAASICITMLGFNFVGDGLRDALDPRLRK